MIARQHKAAVRAHVALLLLLITFGALSASAQATPAGTGWEVTSFVSPTHLSPGGSGVMQLKIINTGAKPSEGSITVTDTLPSGLTAVKAGGMPLGSTQVLDQEEEEEEFGGPRWACSGTNIVTCTSNPEILTSLPVGRGGEAYLAERIGIDIEVDSTAAAALTNHVSVSGGGASSATNVSDPVTVSSEESTFGLSGWDVWFTNADGTPDIVAGSHPYEATFVTAFNEFPKGKLAGGEVRNLEVDLPPGLFGDPNAVPQCTRAQLDGQRCPAETQIGVDYVEAARESGGGPIPKVSELPVYNMVPPPGVPNEFAFSVAGFHAFFEAGVRSAGDYGIVEHIDNVPQVKLDENTLTLWGVPAEASHDFQRNAFECPLGTGEERSGCSSGVIPRPFLTLPTSCAGPQTFTIRGLATWSDPNAFAESTVLTHDASDAQTGFTGCEHLSVDPSLSVTPDTSFGDTPAGFSVDVKVPQEALTLPNNLVASTIKNTTVTLPEGVVINPGQAAGLVACQAAEANVHSEGPQSCPAASKVGTVKIRTPLLEGELESELEGNVYVLQSNPPNLQLLLAASGDGIYLKLVGDVHLNEQTGQLTTTFSETPELPFTDLKLDFSGGGQAALATPTGCGTYTTTSDFTPWTTPFGEDLTPSSSFPIVAGPSGSACSSPMPFTPSMIAGSTTDQAGGFTNFSLLLQRADGQQRISTLQFKTPEGLLGMISKVPLCAEPQAAEGKCSTDSKIGHTVVAAGPGPYPLVVPQPGEPPAPIYLTGGYKGAPYGLSIAVPVITGPFNLGTVVVRSKIEVDPLTAELTVTTDPLPSILDGIPTDLRIVNAVIDRPGFMFNPTNCEPQAFSGTATSLEGTKAPISSHFQMGSCQALKFKPNFKVSTSGKTSRANGASLDAKILYPTGALGNNQASGQSNIKSVKVDLPKQLPSRLTTLQKACTAATFESNPAACPSASKVGQATAITPVLPVKLTGPAYFVSYGGAKFPELVVVLQGYGVTVDLHGETFISKMGITSSTFRKVPDVPITSFDLNLPQGKFSALAANGNLCQAKLAMPTVFTAQDGAVIHQSTPIAVTGCAKTKKKTKANAHHKSTKHKKK
jgi:uncharacterized repeat protein (TIGR01451 family)